MDTKLFFKEIRSIIREEIEYALDRRVKKSPKPANETINHGVSLFKEASKPQLSKMVKDKQTKKVSSKNENFTSIQSILDETRRSLNESVQFDEEYGGNGLMFTTDSLNAFAHQGAIPSGVDPDDLTPEVASALTRDYSALMAKINEKKGS